MEAQAKRPPRTLDPVINANARMACSGPCRIQASRGPAASEPIESGAWLNMPPPAQRPSRDAGFLDGGSATTRSVIIIGNSCMKYTLGADYFSQGSSILRF